MPGHEVGPGSLDARGIAPLYKRLPKGPPGLKRAQVESNQRHRIRGALIESVARHGYPNTSVKRIVAYAGLSRRAFYELLTTRKTAF